MNLLKYLQAAGVPETLQPEALASLQRAEEIASGAVPYKWTAPLVMAWVVPRLAWDAEALPARYAKWDNDISINGDPWPWAQRPDGTWYRPAGRHARSPRRVLLGRGPPPAQPLGQIHLAGLAKPGQQTRTRPRGTFWCPDCFVG